MVDSTRFKFRWVIKNFHMCTETYGEFIESPTFFMKTCESVVNFKLKLYPRGTKKSCKNEIRLCLFRDDTGPDSICIELSSFIVLNNGVTEKLHDQNIKRLGKHQGLGFIFCERNALFKSKKIYLPENTLTLECHLFNQYGRNYSNDTYVKEDCNDEVLESLSSDIYGLLQNHVYSDLTLNDKGRFIYVNKAILKCRCPKLMQQLKETLMPNTMSVEGIEQSDLQILLEYLYSGKVDVSSVSNKMFTIFRTFALPDLSNLFPFPCYMSAITDIEFTRAKFQWVIEDISKLQGNEELVYNPFYNDDLSKNMQIFLSVHSNENKSSNILLKFRSRDTSRIKFQCKVKIEELQEIQDIVKEFQHTFEEDSFETCLISEEFGKILCNDTLHLYFEIALSYSSSKIEDVFYGVKSQKVGCRIIENLRLLQKDLKILYKDREFANATLCVDDRKIPVHKAFLCARSKEFEEMFKEEIVEEQKPIVINDMDVDTVLTLLRYIYYGCIDLSIVTDVVKVYAAAKKYSLPLLMKECSKFLKSNNSIDNIEKIFELEQSYYYGNSERGDNTCLIL